MHDIDYSYSITPDVGLQNKPSIEFELKNTEYIGLLDWSVSISPCYVNESIILEIIFL